MRHRPRADLAAETIDRFLGALCVETRVGYRTMHLFSRRGDGPALTALVVASLANHLGQGLLGLILPLLARSVTDSPVAISGITFSLTLPWLVLGLVSGVLVDRVDRRRMLIGVVVLRAIAVAALAVLLLADQVAIGWLYLVALTLGMTETLLEPALISAIPIVAPGARLHRANAQIIGGRLIIENVAQAISGALIAVGFLLATGSSLLAFVVGIVGFTAMRGSFRVPRTDVGTERAHSARSILAGVHLTLREEPLRTITLASAVINGAWAAWWSVWTVHAVAPGPVGLSSFGLGVLMSVGSVSSLIGTALAVPMQRCIGPRWAIGINIVGNASLFAITALTDHLALIVLGVMLGELGGPGWGIVTNTLQQERVPVELRGRVISAYRFIGFGAKAIGALAGGIGAELVGIPWMYAGCAAITAMTLRPFARFVTNEAMARGDRARDHGERTTVSPPSP